jgi:hypothetical protein
MSVNYLLTAARAGLYDPPETVDDLARRHWKRAIFRLILQQQRDMVIL